MIHYISEKIIMSASKLFKFPRYPQHLENNIHAPSAGEGEYLIFFRLLFHLYVHVSVLFFVFWLHTLLNFELIVGAVQGYGKILPQHHQSVRRHNVYDVLVFDVLVFDPSNVYHNNCAIIIQPFVLSREQKS